MYAQLICVLRLTLLALLLGGLVSCTGPGLEPPGEDGAGMALPDGGGAAGAPRAGSGGSGVGTGGGGAGGMGAGGTAGAMTGAGAGGARADAAVEPDPDAGDEDGGVEP